MEALNLLIIAVCSALACGIFMAIHSRHAPAYLEHGPGYTLPSMTLPVGSEMWAILRHSAFLGFAAVTVGATVTISPVLGVALVGLALGLGLLTFGERLSWLFQTALIAGLLGYMFLGRGFAYAGLSPLFVSELLLGLAILALAVGLRLQQFSFLHILLIAFISWGLIRTAPFIGTYGIDALRDGVVWGYALFALAVASVFSSRFLQRTITGLAITLPVFLIWVPILAVFDLMNLIPVWPQSGVPLAIFKPGDMAVHLAGLCAFMVTGLYHSRTAGHRLPSSIFWVLAISSFVFVAATNRGGLLTVVTGISLAFFLWPSRQLFSLVSVASVLVVIFLVLSPNLKFPGVSREIGPNQIARNVASILSSSETGGEAGLQDTKNWRETWWRKVWGYTVHGPHFVGGKGYGINLSDADGFQTLSDGSSRSPHSGHITILARSGVPGFALWIMIQACFGWTMLRALLRARQVGAFFWAQVDTCILIYWIAMLVNLSFDVYIEGPQGGIWFWTIIGMGMGALRLQTRSPEDPAAIEERDTLEVQTSRRVTGEAPL